MSDRPVARTFDETAEIYERARPGWAEGALDHAIRELGLDRTATVLDLGAGTGKLSERWSIGSIVSSPSSHSMVCVRCLSR